MRLLLSLSFLFLISCGKGGTLIPKKQIIQNIEPAREEMFTYELKGNRCTTGRHEFETHEKACSALLNDSLNNDCAKDERLELYTNESCAS